jgi:hypothetical protein
VTAVPEPTEPGTPLRWERDSQEEDFEAARARELDALARWGREQRLKPLTDALEAHGLVREQREGWGGYVVPSWWAQAAPPERACPWCQAPAEDDDAVCGSCADAQAAAGDPDSLTGWWEALSPLARRLHLSAAHGLDPWTGRAVRIGYESVTIGEAGVRTGLAHLHSVVPRTSWDDLAR